MKRKAVWIGCILATLVCGCAANASVIMTLEQVGPNVVATGNGTVDTTDLTLFLRNSPTRPFIEPAFAILFQCATCVADVYDGLLGPDNFGPGKSTDASTSTGDMLGLLGINGIIFVPLGYMSGTQLSSTGTWDNTTLADLGVTPGSYAWTWGSGAHADSLKLFAGVPVPEPAPALLLTLGSAGTGLLATRRQRLRGHRTLVA